MKTSETFLAARRASLLLAGLLGTTALFSPAQAQEALELDEVVLESAETQEASGDGAVTGYVPSQSRAATRSATPLAKTPVTVNVVGSEQMAQQGANSVAEALRYVPNVQAEYRGTSNFHDEVMIRGFTAYSGKSLDGMIFGGSSNGQIDPLLLDRVEVVKGPASVTYGQVAPGGQINQSLKTPTGQDRKYMELGFGTQDYLSVNGDFEGSLSADGSLRYRVAGAAWQKTFEGGLDQNRFALAPTLEWSLGEDTKVTVSAIYQRDPEAGYRNHQSLEGILEPTSSGLYYPDNFTSYAPAFDEADRTTKSLGYEIEHRFENGIQLVHKARVNAIDLYHKGVSADRVTADGNGVDLFAFEAADSTKQFTADTYLTGEAQTGSVSHNWVAGFDLQKTEVQDTYGRLFGVGTYDLVNGTSPDLSSVVIPQMWDDTTTLEQAGVYVQNQMEMGRWSALLGLRHDWTETRNGPTDGSAADTVYTDQATTGRAALSYEIAEGTMAYASFSTSFTPVIRTDSGGNPVFEPETAEQWEVGAKWTSTDGRLQATAAAFQIEQDGVMEFVSGVGWAQVGKLKSEGYELELRGDLNDQLSLMASYAKVDPRYQEGPNAGNQQQRVPFETAALWMNFAPMDGLTLSLGARHQGKSWAGASNSLSVPSVTLVDFGLSADIGALTGSYDGLTARLSVTNLADKQFVASCANDRVCWRGEGRVISASLGYEW